MAASLPPATTGTVRADGNYEVGHSAFVLAYTKDNLAHVIYPVGLKAEDWVQESALSHVGYLDHALSIDWLLLSQGGQTGWRQSN